MKININQRAALGVFIVLSLAICQSQAGLLTVTQFANLTITIDDIQVGVLRIGLFGQTTPKTVANFAAICAGTPGFSYKGSMFHRIIKGFMCQGGDITNGDGTGGKSIYGGNFPDENFNVTHRVGFVNMANAGPDTNGSQFSIMATIADWLNGHHVVFGKVIEGMDVFRKMENLPTNGADHPIPTPIISDCAVSNVLVPFDATRD